jgi:hypothetical protein
MLKNEKITRRIFRRYAPCDHCGLAILPDQVGFEVELRDGEILRLCPACAAHYMAETLEAIGNYMYFNYVE